MGHTYGVAALVLYLVLLITALVRRRRARWRAGAPMLSVTVLARSGSLSAQRRTATSAREGGSSASVGRIGKRPFGIGMGFALVLAFVLGAPSVGVVGLLLGIAAGMAVAAGWVWTCRRLVGGQTGDLIGRCTP